MSLYNRYFGDYEKKQNDDYHGEYDDDAYGSLYIPYIEEQLASIEKVKCFFHEKNVGDVTGVTFTELVAPKTYKGNNLKKAYSAIVYLKWRVNKTANQLRQAIEAGDKSKCQIKIDARRHWVIHYNTAKFSADLLKERHYVAESAYTAMDMVFRILEDTDEDIAMYELEDTAKDAAMRVIEYTY
jgi:hypothetical protein